MRKLIEGIVNFRRTARPEQRKTYARLALGHAPDALFIGCSDSRVVPNVVVSTDPGDLFVVRNVGNLIPPADAEGVSVCGVSAPAAVEFAVASLAVRSIVVCGHSECAAMKTLLDGGSSGSRHLDIWLGNARESLTRLRGGQTLDGTLTEHNQLSQLNVLLQMEHLLTYPVVRQAVDAGKLTLYGWWFDIGHADVYAYEKDEDLFVLIDEIEAERLLARLK